jgi:general secretion pathway protein K
MHYRPSRYGLSSPVAAHKQVGAALVVAMLVFALSTALVVAMKSQFNRYFQRTASILLAEQAQAYLRGAEELAAKALILDYDQDKEEQQVRDDLGELWASQKQAFALDEGGWLTGSLEDLQGRFNLNHLAVPAKPGTGQPRFTAAQEQFIRLLQALEEPPVSEYEAISITQAVSDWLDADSIPRPEGAEDDYYYGRTPAHRAANRPMASVSELRAVANMTPEIYQALLPWVTVWPQDPKPLNIHTAPEMLLRSINDEKNLSPLSKADGESLAQFREENGFEDVGDLLDHPAFGGRGDKMGGIKGLLDQNSSYFLLRAEVEVAERNMRLYSVLHRSNRQVEALVRASASL